MNGRSCPDHGDDVLTLSTEAVLLANKAPLTQAKCSAVIPFLFLMLTGVPAVMSMRQTSAWPFCAAKCRAVMLSTAGSFTRTPGALKSALTASCTHLEMLVYGVLMVSGESGARAALAAGCDLNNQHRTVCPAHAAICKAVRLCLSFPFTSTPELRHWPITERSPSREA